MLHLSRNLSFREIARKFSVKVKSFEEIPTITKIPILGSTWAYLPLIGKYNRTKFHDFQLAKYREYGPIVVEHMMDGEILLNLFSTADFEKIYQSKEISPYRRSLKSLDLYKQDRRLGLSLLSLQGEEWKTLRKAVNVPILHPKTVLTYNPIFDSVSSQLVERISRDRQPDNTYKQLLESINKWALEAIALLTLNKELGCLKDDPPKEALILIKAVKQMFDCIYKLEFSGSTLWKYMMTPTKAKLYKAADVFTRITEKYIKEAANNGNPLKVDTIASHLLSDQKMDSRSIITMISDMFLAGIDSTSCVVTFLFFHLSKNPEAQQKLYEEVSSIKDIPKEKYYESLHALPYLKACIKETLRLSPPAPVGVRRFDNSLILSGYMIPPNVTLVCHFQITSTLECYCKRPADFYPERWLTRDNPYRPGRFSFLPFGIGPRVCIGQHISIQETNILMAKILSKFRLECDDKDLKIIMRLVNSPATSPNIKFISR